MVQRKQQCLCVVVIRGMSQYQWGNEYVLLAKSGIRNGEYTAIVDSLK
jgi:hypothetical protein